MSKDFKNLPSGFGWSQGTVSPQAHVNVPDGLFEEEHARNGFFGRTSHLYRSHPPTGWLKIEGPLKPRAYQAVQLSGEENGQPTHFLQNDDVKIGIAKLSQSMSAFVRNADGDEVRFIHEGEGLLETDYGVVRYKKGDYVVVPRGTVYRWHPTAKDTHLVVESAGEISLPDRGMLGRHAQFDPMVMRTPELTGDFEKTANQQHELLIKRVGEWTRVVYPWSPINTRGWKGDLTPWAINVADIRPVISPRYHLPPSAHTTFLGRNFVICSFLPRPFESEKGAMKVPFYHSNIDFDEVLFYHAGNFFSREGISAGAVTFHPQGIHHGPHPNAEANAADKTETHEIAVMIDTIRPLFPTEAAESVEWKEYHMSWKADQRR